MFHSSRFLSLVCLHLLLGASLGAEISAPENALPPTITLEAALAATLADSPGMRLELARAEQADGSAEAARGEFDWYAFSEISRGQDRIPLDTPVGAIDTRRSDALNAVVGMTRRLRSGVTVTPTAGLAVADNNLDTLVGDTRSELRLDITVPLMRGLGSVATAQEDAAQLAATGAKSLAAHRISEQATNTVIAFWRALEASRNAAIRAESEEQAQQLFGIVERLVNGGEIPQRTLLEAKADLLRRQADRTVAEAAFFARRQVLAAAIGLAPEAFSQAPLVTGEFPAPIELSALPPSADQRVVIAALRQREDIAAARFALEAERRLLSRSHNNLKPRLDLGLRGTYSGLAAQSGLTPDLSAYGTRVTGPGARVSLRLEWPVQNRVAHGLWRRQAAAVEIAEAQHQLAAQGVAADALTTLESLRLQTTLVDYAAQTVAALELVVANERTKVTNGESSLTNLIQIEDRYIGARILQNSARSSFAQALAEFRRATATLVRSDDKSITLSTHDLTTLPDLPEL